MKKLLTPTHYIENIHDINIGYLANQNIELVIFDLDNTLATSKQFKPSSRVKSLFKKIQKNNMKIMILSNNSHKRVEKFCRKLNIFRISNAFKPSKISFKKIIKHFGTIDFKNIVMIGDQVITDIIYANRNKIKSILVKPISISADEKIIFLNRILEKNILVKIKSNKEVDKIKILKG